MKKFEASSIHTLKETKTNKNNISANNMWNTKPTSPKDQLHLMFDREIYISNQYDASSGQDILPQIEYILEY